MDLRLIEDFLDLASTQNFSRTAQRRYVSQPALSRRIKTLEEWVGTPLFDRTRAPPRLTLAGLALQEAAKDLVGRLHRIREDVRARAEFQTRIRICTINTLAVTFVPRWLKALQQKVDPLRLELRADNFRDGLQSLIDGDVDFFITLVHEDLPPKLDNRLVSRKIADEVFIPISAPHTDRRPRFSLPALSDGPIPYLQYSPESYLGQMMAEIFKRNGWTAQLASCYASPRLEGIKALAMEAYGVAWLTRRAVRAELQSQQLVPAGNRSWHIHAEVRIYRRAVPAFSSVEQVWSVMAK